MALQHLLIEPSLHIENIVLSKEMVSPEPTHEQASD